MKTIFIALLVLLNSQSVLAQGNNLQNNTYCLDSGEQNGDTYLAEVSKELGHQLPQSFRPRELVTIPSEYVSNNGGSEQLRKPVLDAFISLITEAKKENVILKIYSAYRSFDQQCATYSSKFNKFKNKYSGEALQKYVDSISARPGRSEHQLGSTFDLVYPSIGKKLVYPDINNRCPQNKCVEYEWLLANAHKFGFVMSFPRHPDSVQDMNPVTKYIFEPWHWRFVGLDDATEIFNLSEKLGRRISVIEFIKYKKGELNLSFLIKEIRRKPASEIKELVIGMGGDVSLSRAGTQKLDATGAVYNSFTTWDQMTLNLKKMTVGNDFNFLNLESVVTDQLIPVIEGKKWPQKSHPEGVRSLLEKAHFNLISLANNHAYDYDQMGIEETLKHLKKIKESSRNKIYTAGLGTSDETLYPAIIEHNGLRIAFNAIGMKGDDRSFWEKSWRPDQSINGMLSIRQCANGKLEGPMKPCDKYSDLETILENLSKADADLKILSVHEGNELTVYLPNGSQPDSDNAETANKKQRQRSENRNIEAKYNLIKKYNIDLVIGHHSHNVRPIDFNEKTLAFYGLGNLLFLGGQNYTSGGFPVWNQFGLFAKTYYSVIEGKLELSAVQIVPLKNNHLEPNYWNQEKAENFVKYINLINEKSFSDRKVQFKMLSNATAVFCRDGIKKGTKALAVCPE